ncbi:MAG: hypothetical protein PW789_19050 [Edaphobacter sp.]|uniref:hypothetical protein n=1 Tax=Edaphobacter sp. TaxID=1934404 RepID=UPI0023A4500C|nr:hypothetical protein [Edaphobacter sp.]MDE1178678.1 hypothetical protein [Edaphobacter sp.]
MPTNDHEHKSHYTPGHSADDPGYEISDVNANGVLVFISGLVVFLVVFFAFCFVMGKVINGALIKADGPVTKWNEMAGVKTTRERENLASNPEMQQKVLQKLTDSFPTPRMETDDGLQQTADLHAREDLMLEHYSSVSGEDGVRIPIERAMELIAQRGLPVHAEAPSTEKLMAGEAVPVVTAPLTDGFARTGYEQDQIEERKQKMDFSRAENAEHAALAPVNK